MDSHALIGKIAVSLAVTLSLCGCRKATESSPSPEVSTGVATVYAVNYTLKYFADRIGGEFVDVIYPVPPVQDPVDWVPDADTVIAMQNADLVFRNGASYAKWIRTISLPESKLVNTSKGFRDKYVIIEDAITHSHGAGATHTHASTAFTTWLDPKLAAEQAGAIHAALVQLRPLHRGRFDENLLALRRDLEGLDEDFRLAFEGRTADVPILFSRPIYQYLERRYGLHAESVNWEPERFPSERDWKELRELLKEHPARWMIWEREPLEETKRKLTELGVQSALFDPCSSTPAKGDWLDAMHANRSAMDSVFGVERGDAE